MVSVSGDKMVGGEGGNDFAAVGSGGEGGVEISVGCGQL